MDFLSPDFLSLLTGSATGFLFKAMAERRQQDHERFMQAMGKAEKENEHADAAVQRVGIDKPWDLLGLFGEEKVRTYTPVEGYLYTEENRQILVTIVGFYFGTAVRGK